MSELNNTFFVNYVLSSLLNKITVPSEYHEQVRAIKALMKDDVSGLVDMLTDFSVESSSVDFNIETDNSNFTRVLKKWLDLINAEYVGIPTGVNPLAEEYFKERWKSSSFPVLKIGKDSWQELENGIIVPMKLFFVDGESVYADEKDYTLTGMTLENYDYYLGSDTKTKKKLTTNNSIITKPFCRWYEKYPTPYIIKRGVYHNWKIIESLKKKQTEILDRIIPYMMLIKKGTESMYTQKDVSYNNNELQEVVNNMQDLIDKWEEVTTKIKAPIRATNFDEEIKHFIPDLSTIMNSALFAQAERNILSGLGFIDVIEATSTTRRESVLNPKGFIEESKKGIKDFKQILKELVLQIVEKNKSHSKFINSDIRVTSSPLTGFMTDKFKERIRQLWDRGKLSNQTAVEVIGEVDFKTEVKRREQEAKDGIDVTMYPNVTENREGVSIDLPGETSDNSSKKDKDEIPDDKSDPVEKKNYNNASEEVIVELEEAEAKVLVGENYISLRQHEPKTVHSYKTLAFPRSKVLVRYGKTKENDKKVVQSYLFNKKKWKQKDAEKWIKKNEKRISKLVGSPYPTIKSLPKRVKDNMTLELQRVYMKTFNEAYDRYDNDSMASRIAWSVIKKIARKNKKGIWIRKKKKEGQKVIEVKLDRAMIEESIEQTEKEAIDEAFAIKNLETSEKKKSLLDKLFKKK